MASTLGVLNPLTYRSYIYDHETGLYYLQSRYYNPTWGRFLNADAFVSTGQGLLGNNMFAYCRNNAVRRKDVSGSTDVDIFDNELDLTDDDKEFSGGKTSNGGFGGNANSAPSGQTSGTGNGGSSSNTSPTQTSSSNTSISNGNSSSIPQHAYDTLEYIKSHNGSPPAGYKGGRTFINDGRNGSACLPERYAPYREYDVHPKFVGQFRGPERIVIGNGAAFYTPNHYMTFLIME